MKHEVVLTMMCSLMLANFFVGSAFSRLENPIVSIYPFYPAKAQLVSGDNPAHLSNMSRVDSRYVNWTVVFTETGTFNLAVNVTDRYNGVTYVKRTHVDITVFLLMPWDITGPTMWVPDDKCDMSDIALIAKLFGSVEGDGKYDSRADITGSTYLVPDGKIDMSDVALAAKHYGEIY